MSQPSRNPDHVRAMTGEDSYTLAEVARRVYWFIYLRNRKGEEGRT